MIIGRGIWLPPTKVFVKSMWNFYLIGNIKKEWLKISLQPFLTSGSPITESNKANLEDSIKINMNLLFCWFCFCFTEQYINQSWKPRQDSRRYLRILHCKWCQRSKKVINMLLSLNKNKYRFQIFSLHKNAFFIICFKTLGGVELLLLNHLCACSFLNYCSKYHGNEICGRYEKK